MFSRRTLKVFAGLKYVFLFSFHVYVTFTYRHARKCALTSKLFIDCVQSLIHKEYLKKYLFLFVFVSDDAYKILQRFN